MDGRQEPLFTRPFFSMCGFTFAVSLSAFQLFPTAPMRILDLGGTTFEAGLFLAILTFGSAITAPVTGALADRLGKRRVMIVGSLVIAGFGVAYGFSTTPSPLLALVGLHGFFWSGLLSASAAYVADTVPESRHAEGIGFWGISMTLGITVAPSFGFWAYHHGWVALCASVVAFNFVMAAVAFSLPRSPRGDRLAAQPLQARGLVEWRVTAVAISLLLCSFGYGGITSFVAVFTQRLGVSPKGLYFSVFGIVTVVTRLFSGRLADRFGHRRLLLPCLALVGVGYLLLALAQGRMLLVASAVVFGAGFGNMYPAFVAHVLKSVAPHRRGAGFGGVLAAFDSGIGAGSMSLGYVIQQLGFRAAWGLAAALSALAIPYFLWASARFLVQPAPGGASTDRTVR